MKKKDDRKNRLTEAMDQNPRMSLSDAVRMLGISESTARRLFADLEAEGKALRVHGGIQRVQGIGRDYSYESAETRRLPEKKRIAAAAAELIQSGAVVYLDTGTTLAKVCEAIADRIKRDELSDVKVFTNSFTNLNILMKLCGVYLIGGEYRHHRRDLTGLIAEETLRALTFETCVMGADGYLPREGFTTTDFETARINGLVVEHSKRAILACDSSKFIAPTLVRYAKIQQFDQIVTDTDAPDELCGIFSGEGVRVLRV